MAATCQNCGSRLGCGCQKRTASDGKSCCKNCIATYEKSIQKVNTTNTSPTNVQASARHGH